MLATLEADRRAHADHSLFAEVRRRLGHHLERFEGELTDLLAAGPEAVQAPVGFRLASSEQNTLQRQIRLFGQLVAGLPRVAPEMISRDRAGYGSILFVRDLDTGRERFYTLVADDTIGLGAAQASVTSPLGEALLGRRSGDEVEVAAPHRTVRLRILTLKTLPQRLGME